MTRSQRHLWMISAMIWAAALGLTGWNALTIERVSGAREATERLRREMLFQRQNATKLSRIQRASEAFDHTVDSVKLGAIAVRSHLKNVGELCGLESLRVETGTPSDGESRLPVHLTVRGPIDRMVRWLSMIEQYPYLPIDRVEMRIDPESGDTEADAALQFHYTIRALGGSGAGTPGASGRTLETTPL